MFAVVCLLLEQTKQSMSASFLASGSASGALELLPQGSKDVQGLWELRLGSVGLGLGSPRASG